MPPDPTAALRGTAADRIAWLGQGRQVAGVPCPSCLGDGAHLPVLRLPWPGQGDSTLLRCGQCGAGFFHPAAPTAYESTSSGVDTALAFYLQQGAGLWGIASTLAALGRPPGTRLLEVGCGFGFGLDFARRALGWEGIGLDPGPLAAAGRRQLGLPIEPRYLDGTDPGLRARFDVVMASEVLEHVPGPSRFIAAAWDALRPGGTIVLTTPDMDAVQPETLPGLLVPLLSAGYHLTLQTADSLVALLERGGFSGVVVGRSGGASLTATAHRDAAPARSGPAPRGVYGCYLQTGAGAAPADGDLWFGFMARSYREAVNDADPTAADDRWVGFAAACGRRFGFDPDRGLPPAPGSTLEALIVNEPLCLGPVLFHRALHRLLLGERRGTVEPVFAAASAACGRLRAALQRVGLDDGDAEDLGWLAAAEAILCAAERGAPDCADRFAALGAADGARTQSYRRRCFVSLVNAGQQDAAEEFAEAVPAVERRLAGGALLEAEELDVLYCAAARQLQVAGGSAETALGLLRQLAAASAACRAAGVAAGPAVGLVQPAREAEILALRVLGRHAEADELCPAPSRSAA